MNIVNRYKVIPQNEMGETALMLAAKSGNTKVVQTLITAGADIHDKV